MQTWIIILINGIISGTFSFIAYNESRKKNRNDYFNSQVSIIESNIDVIRDKTYELFHEIFYNNKSIDENLEYRLFTQQLDSLQNKIILNSNLNNLETTVVDFNIFATNVVEANDLDSARSHLDIFDSQYILFKKDLLSLQNERNN